MSSYRPASARVLRLRVKDKHAAWLGGLAREVNTLLLWDSYGLGNFELRAGNFDQVAVVHRMAVEGYAIERWI